MAASFLITAISVCWYAPMTLQRYQFQTFYNSLSKLFISILLLSYTPHTWVPYNIAGRTVAIYRRRKWRINGPYIDIVILNIALKATKPFTAAFLIFFFIKAQGLLKSPGFIYQFSQELSRSQRYARRTQGLQWRGAVAL